MTRKNKKQFNWRDFLDHVLYETKKRIQPVQPTAVSGMGAIPNGSSTAFRVWAPHADRVFITGTFNNWSFWRTPLASEKNGYWSTNLPGAKNGDRYKYLIHNDGQTILRTDPYTPALAGHQRDSLIIVDNFDWGEETFQLPSLPDLVIYELHVGTFSTTEEQIVGTFQGVIDRIPYLQNLGVNAIELMPVMEFAGDYSWGYNPAQPFAITETYGGRAALQRLVKTAHDHDIGVIIDVVYNHFGPQDLDLWRFDGWHKEDKGGVYFYNDWRSQTPWADTRPDYGRDAVRRYIRDNVFMWLEEFHVDGLRWDATNFIRNVHGHDGDSGADIAEGWQLMREINAEVAEKHPGRLLIAEDLQNNAAVTQSVVDGGAGFTAQWDAAFVHPVRQAVITPQDEERDMAAVSAAISSRYDGDPFKRILYTESHDEVANGKARVPEEIAPGQADSLYAKKRSILGAALLFSTPGIPMIFQGQEFLEDGWFDDHVPLDWRKAEVQAGISRLYRDLIRLRRNEDGRSRGLLGPHVNVFHVNDEKRLLAYHRWEAGGPGDDVIVFVNFAHSSVAAYTLGFPRAGIWRVLFNSDSLKYDAGFGGHQCPDVVAAPARTGMPRLDEMPCSGNVTLGPYSVLILAQEKG